MGLGPEKKQMSFESNYDSTDGKTSYHHKQPKYNLTDM